VDDEEEEEEEEEEEDSDEDFVPDVSFGEGRRELELDASDYLMDVKVKVRNWIFVIRGAECLRLVSAQSESC
jgi:hypothetical protein